jgi:nucleotide-binding universal stress UspA family protein
MAATGTTSPTTPTPEHHQGTAVVVAFDGSEHARRALHWGAAVATALGRPLAIVRAWDDDGADEDTAEQQTRALRAATTEVVDEEVPGTDVRTHLVRGPATDAVPASAVATDAALLVVGSRGRSGVSALLGSVSRACINRSSVPVLVVPPAAPDPALDGASIVVGDDGSPGARRAVAWAADLAAAAGTGVVVVRGADPLPTDDAAPATAPSADELLDRGVSHRLVAAEDDARHLLTRTASEEDASLVVVGSRGNGPVKALLLGSVAAFVVRHSTRPVVVVPTAHRDREQP